ncbi:MAG: hypothetical protein SF052_18560 [Bacteroidia bacterium]|nr:hypothetical protein [Bacteroidia bacterium]
MNDLSLSGLITLMFQEKRLLQWLYDLPAGTVSMENPNLWEIIRGDKERLFSLVSRGILVVEGESLSLNPTFFLPFRVSLTPGQKPSSHTITEIIDRLQRIIDQYEKSVSPQSAHDHFLNILSFTGMLRVALLLYAESAESHYHNPEQDPLSPVENLKKIYQEVSETLSENLFLTTAEDHPLKQQLFLLQKTMNILREIIQADEQRSANNTVSEDDFLKKIKQLKYLADNHLLQKNTNLSEVVSEEKALLWEEPLVINPHLETDDSQIAKFTKPTAPLLQGGEYSASKEDVFRLKSDFFQSNTDLYHFLAGHPSAEEWTDNYRTHLFFRLLSRFAADLEILPEFIETSIGNFPKIMAKK